MIKSAVYIHSKEIPVEYKFYKASKYIKVRLHTQKRVVVVSAPLRTSRRKIDDFLETVKPWIQEKWDKLPAEKISIYQRSEIMLLGKNYRVDYQEATRKHMEIRDDVFIIRGPQDKIESFVIRFLKAHFYDYVFEKSQEYAKILKVKFNKISVKEIKSRWGSCSSQGNISYCWRLIFAPQDIIDYVCAHEVCHLKVMNHSAAFWHHVQQLTPDYKKDVQWLKKHGMTLF